MGILGNQDRYCLRDLRLSSGLLHRDLDRFGRQAQTYAGPDCFQAQDHAMFILHAQTTAASTDRDTAFKASISAGKLTDIVPFPPQAAPTQKGGECSLR